MNCGERQAHTDRRWGELRRIMEDITGEDAGRDNWQRNKAVMRYMICLRLYRKRPYKTANKYVWGGGGYITLPKEEYPWISWDDPEPVECEVTVRVKKGAKLISGLSDVIAIIKKIFVRR